MSNAEKKAGYQGLDMPACQVTLIFFFLFCHIKKEIAAVTPCCLISVSGEIALVAKSLMQIVLNSFNRR